jgi:hypothetical protein
MEGAGGKKGGVTTPAQAFFLCHPRVQGRSMHLHEDASVRNLSWALRRFTSPSRLSSFWEAASNALDSAEALACALAPAPPCIRAPGAEALGHVPCAMLCSGTPSRNADAHTAATAHAEAVKKR